MNILCVHGVGHGDQDTLLAPAWTNAITTSLRRWNPEVELKFTFLQYDKLFSDAPHNPATYAEAMARLLNSGIVHGLGDLFSRRRGLFELPGLLRWTAGMVAQWASDDDLRQKTRDWLAQAMAAEDYNLICAHSLGTLISYDTFKRTPKLIRNRYFISFGSQIGNPFIRDMFAGRIEALEAGQWFHLYNPNDHVMTAEVALTVDNFLEVGTPFDVPNDILNHDPVHYLTHPAAEQTVWSRISGKTPATLTRSMGVFAAAFTRAKPRRRALLVGINAYPDPANRLEGCVNDVFLMSSLLQECGFDPEDIRVLLDERATRDGIWTRLHWLLDDLQPGDQRVFFYSGHGAQMPAYGPSDEVDHTNETLVPYDFDWSPGHAIDDKQFCELYSQLPYDSRFVALLDCCHAGGLTRDGTARVRGINPPDDVRHRSLKWNSKAGMWEERLAPPEDDTRALTKHGAAYVGENGVTHRLGRAIRLRQMERKKYDKERKDLGHEGPYLPILMEACRETELASEYRHGAISYGAFTFSLGQILRQNRARLKNLSFADLAKLIGDRLEELNYEQHPCLVGPKTTINAKIPWVEEKTRQRRKPNVSV